MRDDDELCLCFHVTKRKVKNFIRIHRPRVASEISECGGAGTGCGWCRPVLRRLLEQFRAAEEFADAAAADPSDQDSADYRQARQAYLAERERNKGDAATIDTDKIETETRADPSERKNLGE